MVLGFGKGPERFPAAKEQTPGPGAYDPKELETKLPPKSGFLTAERFSSQELEGKPDAPPREPSPPRERRPVNPGNDRSYSWATQRIHELNKDLEGSSKRVKALTASNAELEERLNSKVLQCQQQAAAAIALQQQLDTVRADLVVQTEAIAVTTAKLNEAQDLINQQKRELLSLESEMGALSAFAQDQTRALADRVATIEQLQELSRCKDMEVAKLSEQLTAERAALKVRVEEVLQLTHTLVERDASLRGLTSELAEAKSVLQERDVRLVELQTKVEAAVDTVTATNELLSTLEASLSKKESDITALKGRISDLEVCNAELQGDLRTQRETCSILSAELETARSALADGAAIEAALREKLTLTENVRQQVQEQCAQLCSELAAAKETYTVLSQSHDALTQSEAALRLELQDQQNLREHEGAELHNKLAEVQGELSAKLAASQQEAQVLQTRLQEAHEAAEKQTAEVAHVRAQLASHSATVEKLQLTVANMEQMVAELEAARAQLAQALSSTQLDLSSSVLRCNELESRVAELEAVRAKIADQYTCAQVAMEQLRAEKQEIIATATADADQASARVTALEVELAESRNAAASLGAELAQLVTDLEAREQEIKELKVARHETSSALTAATAERADLCYQLEELRRRDMDMQTQLATARAYGAKLEAETQSLKVLVTATQEEARQARDETYTLSEGLDKAREQIRTLQLQEIQMESLRQELEAMCLRLQDTEARNEVLQNQVAVMEGRVATMTPICSRAKLDDQVRALSEALEKSHLRSNELEDQVRRNVLLEHTAVLELRRLTDENDHLVNRMMKLEEDLKEQSALGHNNHKQKIQYHLRLKQELEELRHECTVLLRDKFQLEQCIRYLAVKVGMGPGERRQSLATAERKAIEKVLPACLAYNAIYSTPLSQRAMRLSARGKNNDQGTVYAGGKETFEEGINEAQRKFFSVATNLRNEFQFAAAVAAVAISSPIAENPDSVAEREAAEAAEVDGESTRPDTCGSPDGKAARDPAVSHAAALFGTPIATIRGAGTPASGSTQGTVNGGGPPSLAKLEERIKQLISDVCAPATSRNPVGVPSISLVATDVVTSTPAVIATVQRGATAGASARDRDQDKEKSREGTSAIAGPSTSTGGATGGNGGPGISGGGAGAIGNGGGRERAPRASLVSKGDAVAPGSRVQATQSRRLTTVATGVRTTSKS
ncbi:hypothetical protein Vretimale_367 [Volvox reticuliferus]|uniref:Uncharacterized protein n=1 Tax=Volvox reticuliferus TaxID=1737510 RepID=A0A8J4CAA9_9CHLO|nr:hypothetical protein Vretifemale_8154 [Volvox reticuliferus]GIL94023.1 hypothetical protein Vretimale_367 [Volvox reticuliferus]